MAALMVPVLTLAGGAHLPAAAQGYGQQDRQQHQQYQRQLPAQGEHHRQRAHDGHQGDEQILRPVVGQLRQFKQVAGQAAHQLAGAVAVVEVEAQLLNVAVQIAADIRLHADAEGVAPVGHHEVQRRAQHIGGHHHRHDDAGDEERAGQVQGEEPPVGFEVGEEYPQGAAGLIIFRGHAMPRLVFF